MKFKTWLYLAGGVVWALVPFIAEAALVPCGISTGNLDANGIDSGAISCNLCYLGQLIQNIINFLVGISIPISVLMFGYAGILMFTNADNPERVSHGKKIFQSVFMGFVLVITGWLIVQTVIGVVVEDSFNFTTYWNGLSCVKTDAERFKTTHGSIGEYINGVLGTPTPQVNPGTPITVPGCAPGLEKNQAGTLCYDPLTGKTSPVTKVNSGRGTVDPALAARIAATCKTAGGLVCSYAESISLAESSGGTNCITSDTGAVGCFQVLSTTACDIRSSVSSSCDACVASKRSKSVACQPVAAAIADPTINTELGVTYVAQLSKQFNNSCRLTAAAYYRGAGNVRKAQREQNNPNAIPVEAIDYVAKVCSE